MEVSAKETSTLAEAVTLDQRRESKNLVVSLSVGSRLKKFSLPPNGRRVRCKKYNGLGNDNFSEISYCSGAENVQRRLKTLGIISRKNILPPGSPP